MKGHERTIRTFHDEVESRFNSFIFLLASTILSCLRGMIALLYRYCNDFEFRYNYNKIREFLKKVQIYR